jgi:hypothetical protein
VIGSTVNSTLVRLLAQHVAEPDIERRKITDFEGKVKEKKRKWKEGKKIGRKKRKRSN